MTAPHLIAVGALPNPVRMGQLYDALNAAFEIVVPQSAANGGLGVMLKAQEQAALQAWVTARTALTLRLSVSSFSPTGDTVIGQIVEPTASWYAAPTVTLGTPYIGADGLWHIPIASHEFVYSGSDPSVNINGWGLVDTF